MTLSDTPQQQALVNPGPAGYPQPVQLAGTRIALIPLNAVAHAQSLFEELGGTEKTELWRFMGDGPFEDFNTFSQAIARKAAAADAAFFAIVDKASQRALGYASLMRIDIYNRCIEVGNIVYGPGLQKTSGATEAMYLLARHVFEDLGYRRYEWKCNALNQPSRRAALRLGFRFEGIFRQHMIVKGRNRDTAWFAMLDGEWPARKAAFEKWLSADNFDSDGRQRTTLEPPASDARA